MKNTNFKYSIQNVNHITQQKTNNLDTTIEVTPKSLSNLSPFCMFGSLLIFPGSFIACFSHVKNDNGNLRIVASTALITKASLHNLHGFSLFTSTGIETLTIIYVIHPKFNHKPSLINIDYLDLNKSGRPGYNILYFS